MFPEATEEGCGRGTVSGSRITGAWPLLRQKVWGVRGKSRVSFADHLSSVSPLATRRDVSEETDPQRESPPTDRPKPADSYTMAAAKMAQKKYYGGAAAKRVGQKGGHLDTIALATKCWLRGVSEIRSKTEGPGQAVHKEVLDAEGGVSSLGGWHRYVDTQPAIMKQQGRFPWIQPAEKKKKVEGHPQRRSAKLPE